LVINTVKSQSSDMSCKFGHFCFFCQNSDGRKQQIIIKHFKAAKNSIDPNKYHLVKAFSDIKILFISRLVLDLQIFFKTLSVSELRVNKPNSIQREQNICSVQTLEY
jgi:hypothetical protein